MTTPHPDDSLRNQSDEFIHERRRDGDNEREEQREVQDRTRQNARGRGQAQAGLERERALDDASREEERSLLDRRLSDERGQSDRSYRKQAGLLEAAEDRLDVAREEEDAAALERRDSLRAAGAELDRLDEVLGEIRSLTERSSPELTAAVAGAFACSGRLARSLKCALDVEDASGDHHELGGSG